MHALKFLTATLMVIGVVGCSSTHSDRLNFAGEKEGSMTYAQAYEPARQLLVQGKASEIKGILQNENGSDGKPLTDEQQKEKLIKTSSELAILEKALLALNAGDPVRARFFFDAAEIKAEQEERKGTGAKIGSASKTVAAAITGAEELRNYELKGFEKVMLLNYKSLTYLLTGDYEKAYNVARRAIDLQD